MARQLREARLRRVDQYGLFSWRIAILVESLVYVGDFLKVNDLGHARQN
jgi:hypothetical protein